MRTVGFLFVLIGGLLAYLGIQGKVGQAFSAIRTGEIPAQTFEQHYSTSDPSGGR